MDLQFARGSLVRAPSLRLLANGTPLEGALSAEISAVGHHAADRFQVALALSATDRGWFAAQPDIQLNIQIGLDGSWVDLLTGPVDCVSMDPINGLLHLDGRDLTASFISARTRESFANHTASEIVVLLAGRHGLAASVTPTSVQVGRYYESEHDRITLDQFSRMTTEWDLLVFLAQQEGYDIYVQGVVLQFHPPVVDGTPGLLLTPADCLDLRLDRSLPLAAGVEVVVRSWSSRQQTAVVQTASSPGGGAAQQYVFVRPNLTADQAMQFAQTMLADLSRHERVISATIPGELALTPRDIVTLAGTGTAFDQSYRVASIDRSISVERGFVQHVRAKNRTAASS